MPKFRKKPVIVEAEQWFPDKEVAGVCRCSSDECGRSPHVHTLEGALRVSDGDFIITGVQQEKYPCKPDIFAATYEPVAEGEAF